MKCKKGEVQGRLRKDRVVGLSRKHALECLRHGADLSCQRQGSAPGPWKVGYKGGLSLEFLRLFGKRLLKKRKSDAKAYGKNAFIQFSCEFVQR